MARSGDASRSAHMRRGRQAGLAPIPRVCWRPATKSPQRGSPCEPFAAAVPDPEASPIRPSRSTSTPAWHHNSLCQKNSRTLHVVFDITPLALDCFVLSPSFGLPCAAPVNSTCELSRTLWTSHGQRRASPRTGSGICCGSVTRPPSAGPADAAIRHAHQP